MLLIFTGKSSQWDIHVEFVIKNKVMLKIKLIGEQNSIFLTKQVSDKLNISKLRIFSQIIGFLKVKQGASSFT
jgi:hypothetical protein